MPLATGSPPHRPEVALDNNTSIALSRLVAQQRAMDVTANNIANADTPAYRASRMLFSDWLQREPGGGGVAGGQTLSFTQDRATWHDRTPGTVTMTGNPLDLAIGRADAWFTVQTANGPRLTRAGHFNRAPDGRIVDDADNPLLDTAGQPIRLATGDTRISVAGDGAISTESGPVARIGMVTPADDTRLQAEGGRLYMAGATPTAPVAAPHLTQGGLEQSNVQPITEMTAMTTQLREFQFVSQFVQAEADRQQGAIDKILRKGS